MNRDDLTEIQRPAWPALVEFSERSGIKLENPITIEQPDGTDAILIFGRDPCIYLKGSEAGIACRAFVEQYASTGDKFGTSHDERDFRTAKAREMKRRALAFQLGREPTDAELGG